MWSSPNSSFCTQKKVFTEIGTVFPQNSGEDQKKKKRSSPELEQFFHPNSGEDESRTRVEHFSSANTR